MWSQYYQSAVAPLVQKALVRLCMENVPYDNKLEIDGIVCISAGDDSKQIVIKVHETLEEKTTCLPQKRPRLNPDPTQAIQANAIVNRTSDHIEDETNVAQEKNFLCDINSNVPCDPAAMKSQLSHPPQPLRSSTPVLDQSRKTASPKRSRSRRKPFMSQKLVPVTRPVLNNIDHDTDSCSMDGDVYEYKLPDSIGDHMIDSCPEDELGPLDMIDNQDSSPASSHGFDTADDGDRPHDIHRPLEGGMPMRAADENGVLKCKSCTAVFSSYDHLESHNLESHGRYTCKQCQNTFSMQCNLRRHERIHTGHKPFACDICQKSFARSTDLKLHMVKHNNNAKLFPYSCTLCPKSFANSHMLKGHQQHAHQVYDAGHVCFHCDKTFSNKEEYAKHCETHNVGKTSEVTRHMLLNNGGTVSSSPKPFKAHDLSTKSSTGALGYGYLMHNRNDENAIPLSQKNFSTAEYSEPKTVAAAESVDGIMDFSMKTLKAQEAIENNNTVYNLSTKPTLQHVSAVSLCNNSASSAFEQINKLIALSAPHSEARKSPILGKVNDSTKFQTAGSRYEETRYSLNNFGLMSGSHTVFKPERAEDLRLHSSTRSTPERSLLHQALPSAPSMIGSRSASQSPAPPELSKFPILSGDVETKVKSESMIRKPRIATISLEDFVSEEREYTCGLCSRTFSGFQSYDAHYIEIHLRFPCPLCDQSFTGKNNRTRHMRMHTGQRKYVCKDCGKCFTRPDSLKDHKYIHTASYQENECKICLEKFSKKSMFLAHIRKCCRGDVHTILETEGNQKYSHLEWMKKNASQLEVSGGSAGSLDVSNLSTSTLSDTSGVQDLEGSYNKYTWLKSHLNRAWTPSPLTLGHGELDGSNLSGSSAADESGRRLSEERSERNTSQVCLNVPVVIKSEPLFNHERVQPTKTNNDSVDTKEGVMATSLKIPQVPAVLRSPDREADSPRLVINENGPHDELDGMSDQEEGMDIGGEERDNGDAESESLQVNKDVNMHVENSGAGIEKSAGVVN